MKLIIAVIQPHRLEAVKQALADVEVFRLTVMDVQGFGRQRGQTEVYRGHEFAVNLLRKVQLMIAVNEEFLEPTIDAILRGGRSGAAGEIGDGKIFVLPLEDCIRIRTGETRRRGDLAAVLLLGGSQAAGQNSKSETRNPNTNIQIAKIECFKRLELSDFLFAIHFVFRGFIFRASPAIARLLPLREHLAQQHAAEIEQRERAGHQAHRIRVARWA